MIHQIHFYISKFNMTSCKLSFRFKRQNYSEEVRTADNDRLKQKLTNHLQSLEISIAHLHIPSRNLIKALFNNEEELNKVLYHKASFVSIGFLPVLSRPLKTKRTVYCSGFDPSLLQTYSKHDIQEFLENDDWKVTDIYIMNNNRSFKIEFDTTQQASDFLDHQNTNLGGIRLQPQHTFQEIDTSFDQCWGCGQLQTDHTTQDCQAQICLYCGSSNHKFYSCTIPMKHDKMTIEHKSMLYCAPCDMTGDHTSLDHSLCPKKKKIINKRIQVCREMREDQIKTSNKDKNFIKNVFEFIFRMN